VLVRRPGLSIAANHEESAVTRAIS